MKKTNLIILISALTFFVSSHFADASSTKVYFSAPESAAVGSEISVKALIDSDSPLNGYSLGISFPADKIKIVSFDDSRSIISVWQTRPAFSESGAIALAGVSITPFSGGGGEIIIARFQVLKEGKIELSFINPLVYVNDGKGTEYTPIVEPAPIVLTKSTSEYLASESGVTDKTPPEIKELSLSADPLNPEQKLVGFLVKDAGSGVKEIRGRLKNWFLWTDWQEITNPAAVGKNVWAVEISASDNKGNVALVAAYDWKAFIRGPGITLLVVLIVFSFIFFFGRFYKTK